jgi:ribosome-binding factor A
VADQIRGELALMLVRDVHDPGIGFVTITRVQVSPDLQVARIFYTVLGDEKARKNSARALERAAPFLRRQIGSRLRLKRVPELRFQHDDATAGAERIDQIINELHERERDEGEVRLKADTTGADTTSEDDGGDRS